MTTPQIPTISPEKLRPALAAYRTLAWATGLWLIALCFEIYSHLVLQNKIVWIEIVHGWVYFAYMLAAFNLAIKVRWPFPKTVGVLLSGTIPLLGIIVEQRQTRQIKAHFGL